MEVAAGPIRLRVDFNYGGRLGDRGIVYLGEPSNRGQLLPTISELFAARGAVATPGVRVVIWDVDEDAGAPLTDLEVDAIVGLDADRGWFAEYEWGDLRHAPHGP